MDFLSRRVKIYQLNGTTWEDKGTGFCSCRKSEDDDDKYKLVVTSELDQSVLLETQIETREQYHKDQETLLIWREPPDGPNLCLSFQQAADRDAAFKCILTALKIDPKIDEIMQSLNEPTPILKISPLGDIQPDMYNLEVVESQIIILARTLFSSEKLSQNLLEQNFVRRLKPVYETAFKQGARKQLTQLFNIIRTLINLADHRILEVFCADDVYLVIAGIMDCDPEFKGVNPGYQQYLEDPSRFRQVLEFPDPEIRQKVHESFRLNFLKETVLCRIMDESISSRFSRIINNRNSDIVTYFANNHEYLSRLFAMLRDSETPISQKRNIILFVQQLLNLSRISSLVIQNSLMRLLNQKGLFSVFYFTVSDSDLKIRVIGAEILSTIVEQDPALVRSTLRAQIQSEETTLLEVLIGAMITETSSSVIIQYSDIIKILLINHGPSPFSRASYIAATDPSNRKIDPDLDQFVAHFYDKIISLLVSPLTEFTEGDLLKGPDSEPVLILSNSKQTLCNTICDLLIVFLRFHNQHIRTYILSSSIVEKISLLLKSKAGHVKLAALRFFRAIAATKDEFYNKAFIKYSVIASILDLYIATSHSRNMINSSCLEFFEFIRCNNIQTLIEHIAVTLEEDLMTITDTSTFSNILVRYHQNLESTADTIPYNNSPDCKSDGSASPTPLKKPGDWNSVDSKEENYFKEDDEDATEVLIAEPHFSEELGAPPKPLTSLVDYDDEEDAFESLSQRSKSPKKSTSPFKTSIQPVLKTIALPLEINVSGTSQTEVNEVQIAIDPKKTIDTDPSDEADSTASNSSDCSSEDFTEDQKNKILHYEEEESHVHLEEPVFDEVSSNSSLRKRKPSDSIDGSIFKKVETETNSEKLNIGSNLVIQPQDPIDELSSTNGKDNKFTTALTRSTSFLEGFGSISKDSSNKVRSVSPKSELGHISTVFTQTPASLEDNNSQPIFTAAHEDLNNGNLSPVTNLSKAEPMGDIKLQNNDPALIAPNETKSEDTTTSSPSSSQKRTFEDDLSEDSKSPKKIKSPVSPIENQHLDQSLRIGEGDNDEGNALSPSEIEVEKSVQNGQNQHGGIGNDLPKNSFTESQVKSTSPITSHHS